jgi:hypothetical protein
MKEISKNNFLSFFETFELVDAMAAIKRHRLLVENPNISASELEAKIEDWYLSRPNAPDGDASGDTFRKRAAI